MHISKKLLSLSAVLLAPLLLVAGSASSLPGATTIGSASPGNATCASGYTVLQTTSPGGSYAAPTAGVITAFSLVTDTTPPATLNFKVARPTGGAYAITASVAAPSVGASRTVEAPARVAVQPGDVIGFSYTGNFPCDRASTTHQYSFLSTDAPVGSTVPAGTVAYQLNVQAVLEPDADGDGFGDLTQDRCSTDKSTQGPCPPAVVDRTAPETTITSVVAKKAKSAGKKASVTATFAASETSTFECAVDSPVFVPCSSPYVTKLKVGKHTLAVRATDAAGNVDRSAAVTSVKVKVGKPKK